MPRRGGCPDPSSFPLHLKSAAYHAIVTGPEVVRFSEAVGEVLRRARRERGLTLHEVRRRSRGRFKPSSVGCYERGERAISLDRFCQLAAVYGMPADRLLADILAQLAPEGRREIVIDLNRLSGLRTDEARLVSEFVHKIKSERGDYLTDVITLRSGDLEAQALATGVKPQMLLTRLRPALGRNDAASE